MSSNAPQDPWVPKPVHRRFRNAWRVGRGKNRHWEFKGQHSGETVKGEPLRKHKFFLITPALPLIGTTIVLIIVLALDINFSQAGPLWTLLALIFGVLFLLTGVYFIYHDLLLWWLEITVITNQRMVIFKGFLKASRQAVPIENVVQVGVEQKSFLSLLLSYGDVHLYLVGGKGAILEKIPNPKRVRDLFQRVKEEAKQNKTPEQPHPKPASPDLQAVLAKLAQDDPFPWLPPNPDGEDSIRSGGLRGPRRTFGWPLRLECDVTYTTDERTVEYLQRSRFVLVGRLIVPVLVLLGVIIVTLYVPSIFVYSSFGILASLLWIGLTIVNYTDDVYILTNKRVIDIERRLVFLNEQHEITEYGQIKEIKVNVRNVLFRALNIGDVIVETPGNNPNITLLLVDDPFKVSDKIFALKEYKDKADKIKAKNERKKELNQWFGTVLDTMERKVLGRGVPNLQKLDLWTAAQRASALGWLVVPVGEDTSHPNIDPGTIVDQDPQPGTLIQFNPDDREERPKIRVTLSARP